MAPIAAWNPSNLHENTIVRSTAALPFIVLLLWSFISLKGFSGSDPVTEHLDSTILSGRIRLGSINVPISTKFLDIKVLDDFWRPRALAFAPSTLGTDPAGWFQNFGFCVDYSLLYCIWLLESAKRSNEYSPVRFPVLFGLFAQVFGLGIIAPLYFFLHYANSPLSHHSYPKTQNINPHFSRAVFLTLCLFSYLPISLMFLGPSPSIRLRWTWAWQMFPLWVSIAQWIRTRTSALSSKTEPPANKQESENSSNDNNIIRSTISTFAAVSAGVWIYTLLNSPYPLAVIFIPKDTSNTELTFVSLMRRHFQVSHLSAFGGALMWLVYLFADLKSADLVQQSWIFLLSMGGLTTLCFGPGVTIAAGWYWREEILRYENTRASEARVGDENGRGRYKKLARQSLDGLCFGGTKGRFKVL